MTILEYLALRTATTRKLVLLRTMDGATIVAATPVSHEESYWDGPSFTPDTINQCERYGWLAGSLTPDHPNFPEWKLTDIGKSALVNEEKKRKGK